MLGQPVNAAALKFGLCYSFPHLCTLRSCSNSIIGWEISWKSTAPASCLITGDATGRMERLNMTGSSVSSLNSSQSTQSVNSDVVPWLDMKPTSTAFYSPGTLSG